MFSKTGSFAGMMFLRISCVLALVFPGVSCNSGRYHLPGADAGDGRYAITFFVTADCPLCKAYKPLISGLQDSLSSAWSVRVVRMDMPDTVKVRRGTYGLEWGDSNGRIAGRFGATVTPEVFLTDLNSGSLLYSGAIDNYAWETGKHRPAATEHYLKSAIDAVKRGKKPEPAQTKAIGCFIEH